MITIYKYMKSVNTKEEEELFTALYKDIARCNRKILRKVKFWLIYQQKSPDSDIYQIVGKWLNSHPLAYCKPDWTNH